MKSYDYDAMTYNADIYCIGCLPVEIDSLEVHPVFADSEWDYYPTCAVCGETHTYMSLTTEGQNRRQ